MRPPLTREDLLDGLLGPSLVAVLGHVPDPRTPRGRRYPWPALLSLLLVALLCGATTQRACARWGQHVGWARLRRLGFTRRGGPSLATLHRLRRQVPLLAPETTLGQGLQQARARWAHGPCRWFDGSALDGTTLRGARRLGAQAVHLLSA